MVGDVDAQLGFHFSVRGSLARTVENPRNVPK